MAVKNAAQARNYLIKAKFYRFFAIVFAVVGLVLFTYLYFEKVSGHFFEAIKEPWLVLIILIPFLPAAILSWIASRMEKKLMKVIEDSHSADKKS